MPRANRNRRINNEPSLDYEPEPKKPRKLKGRKLAELQERQRAMAASLAAKSEAEREHRVMLDAKKETIELKAKTRQYEKQVQELEAKVNEGESRVRDLEEQLKALRKLEDDHARVCEEHRKKLEEQQQQLLEMDRRRQAAVDELYEATGKIYVYVRVRPALLPKEAAEAKALVFPKPNTVAFASGRSHEHRYSTVWAEDATQETVFKELRRFVQDVLDGISCCVFAYGQTGSGKTYTLYGNDDAVRDGAAAALDNELPGMGIIPRALRCVFGAAATLREAGWRYEFTMSFVEVYNEQLRDLLDLAGKPVLRSDKSGVPKLYGVCPVAVASAAEAFDQLRRAEQNRTIAATSFNEQSSRSHVLFRLSVAGTHAANGTTRSADLDIVDLAGSEKYDSGAAAVRLAETANINLSLLSLMNVISGLAHRKAFVSFRDSVLTRVLQSSLGGRSKVAVIVNVSPCAKDEDETISSLRFADDTNGCFLKGPVGVGSNTTLAAAAKQGAAKTTTTAKTGAAKPAAAAAKVAAKPTAAAKPASTTTTAKSMKPPVAKSAAVKLPAVPKTSSTTATKPAAKPTTKLTATAVKPAAKTATTTTAVKKVPTTAAVKKATPSKKPAGKAALMPRKPTTTTATAAKAKTTTTASAASSKTKPKSPASKRSAPTSSTAKK